MQSEACQLPVDAHSLMQSPLDCRGKPSARKHLHFHCQIQNPLSSHITTTFSEIIAKQQQQQQTKSLIDFQTMPLIVSRRTTTSQDLIVLLRASKELIINTHLLHKPFQDWNDWQPAALECCQSFMKNQNHAGCPHLRLITPALCHFTLGKWTKSFCYWFPLIQGVSHYKAAFYLNANKFSGWIIWSAKFHSQLSKSLLTNNKVWCIKTSLLYNLVAT